MIYYNKTGSLVLGNISDSEDVILIANGSISAGNVVGSNITIYAGFSFTLSPDPHPEQNQGTAPLSTTINFTGGSGSGTAALGGVNATGSVNAQAGSFIANGSTVSVAGDIVANCDTSITSNSSTNFIIGGGASANGVGGTITVTKTTASSDFGLSIHTVGAGNLVLEEADAITVSGSESFPGTIFLEAFANLELSEGLTASNKVKLKGNNTNVKGDLDITGDVEILGNYFDSNFPGVEEFTIDGSFTTSCPSFIQASQSINITDDVSVELPRTVLLYCGGNIATGQISIDNSGASAGGARSLWIRANEDSLTADTFVVGGSGNSNGVNGSINIDTVNGGAQGGAAFDSTHGVHIYNGGAGGITVMAGSNISVKATQSISGAINLESEAGTITLPSAGGDNVLSTDGTGSFGAGLLQIKALTISASDSIVSASDNNSGQTKFITLACNSLEITTNLTVNNNGDGRSDFNGGIGLWPPQRFFLPYPADPLSPPIGGAWPDSLNFPLTVSGAGSLTLNSNGSWAYTTIGGYPLIFEQAGTLDVHSDHTGPLNSVNITHGEATTEGITGLQFNCDQVTITCNGPATGGDAGQINIWGYGPISAVANVSLTANGTGAGNGGSIFFSTGADLPVGAGAGQFLFTAKGGPTQGNGGNVQTFIPWESTYTLHPGSFYPIDVSADGNGSGGQVMLVGGSLTDNGDGASLHADGNGAGFGGSTASGGEITFILAASILLGPGDDNVTLSAVANGTGDGGHISLDNPTSSVTISGDIAASSGTEGNGGTITIAQFGSLSLDGSLLARGAGGGTGGSISINGNNLNFTTVAQELNADGPGGGGQITLVSNSGPITIGSDTGAIGLSAQATTSGDGGSIIIDSESQDTITIDTTSLSVTTAGIGKGGSMLIVGGTLHFPVTGQDLNADGYNAGGSITLGASSGDISIGSGEDAISLSARSLDFGDGGTISISSQGNISVDSTNLSVQPAGSGNGSGGIINVTGGGGASNVSVTGTLDASGVGSGQGGAINLIGTNLMIDSSQLLASGGANGSGGNITLNNANTDGSSGLIVAGTGTLIQSNGGNSSGNGGAITLASGSAISLGAGVTIDSSALAAIGDGGPIAMTSVNANSMTFAGMVKSSAGATSGMAGDILLSDSNPGGSIFTFTADSQTIADSPNDSISSLSLVATAGDLVVQATGGLLSCNEGKLVFTAQASGANVTVNAAATPAGNNPLLGTVNANGTDVSFVVDSILTGSLTLGDIVAASDLSVVLTGQGSLVFGGGALSASTLGVVTEGGDIGGPDDEMISTAVTSLHVESGQSAYISNANNGALLNIVAQGLNVSKANGTFQVLSDGDITIGTFTSNGIVSQGDVLIESTSSTSTITNSSDLKTTGGNIALSVGGDAAQTCPATTLSCVPAGVQVTGTLSNVFFNNTTGIHGPNTGVAQVKAFNGRTVSLDAKSAGTISLPADSSVEAQ